MSNYTAEDFAKARFAVHPDPVASETHYAARMSRDPEFPWLLDGLLGNGDEHMARDGWVPVVESRITEHTLEVAQSNAERKRQKLLDHIADQDRVIRRRNDEIERLIRDNMQVHDLLRAPLSLDTLREAWETAEASEDCRVGDVLIEHFGPDAYHVYLAEGDHSHLPRAIRVLSRAPRAPWQDLADVLEPFESGRSHAWIEQRAKLLHAAGVRVTGGDES